VLVLLTYFMWNVGDTWYGAIGLFGATITMVVVSLFTQQDQADSKEFYLTYERANNRFYDVQE